MQNEKYKIQNAKYKMQEEAVQYMLDHTAASEQNVRNEVTRWMQMRKFIKSNMNSFG